MKKIITHILLLLSVFSTCAQLDPLYNQYLFNQQMINPAYVGIYNRFSAGLISRAQWAGIEGAPLTNTLTVQSALANGRIGIGTLLINDQLGINSNTELFFTGAYNIKVGEQSKLGLGLQGGLINYRYDITKLNLNVVDDPLVLNGLDNSTEPNFGVGVMYMSPVLFVGASIPRISAIEVEDGVSNSTRYKRHYYLTGGFIVETSRFLLYRFNGLLRYVDDGDLSYELSVSNHIDDVIWAGISIRDLRDFGLFVLLEVGKNLRFGYSIEFPSNSLIQSNYGTHEISIAFDAALKRNRVFNKRRF